MIQREAVESVIHSEFGATLGHRSLDPNEDLLANGVIDSFGLVGLIAALEHRFGITVAEEDVVPENFQTVDQLAAFVEFKQAAGGSGGSVGPGAGG